MLISRCHYSALLGALVRYNLAHGFPDRADYIKSLTGVPPSLLSAVMRGQQQKPNDLSAPVEAFSKEFTENGSSWRVRQPEGFVEWCIDGELLALPPSVESLMGSAKRFEIVIDHCTGGAAQVGFDFLSRLDGRPARATVSSLAASAAAMLFTLAPGQRRIWKSAKLMFHCAASCIMANASALRAQADELEEIDRRSIELLVVRTGLPRQVVASWFDGEDHTFSAGEAISAGLADALVEPEDD